ncbi:MAG: hypothetical protein AAB410_05065 [Patescibacteria group bacterium]
MKLINLLPKEKQKELGYKRLSKTVISLIWITVASFILVLLAQFGAKAYLQGQEAGLKASIEDLKAQASKEENAQIKAKITQLNDMVADYRAISGNVAKLSKVIRQFAPLIPSGINITSMKIDSGNRVIDITGQSPTRELVIRLYENIVDAKNNFPDIDYPLENVAKPVDIGFHFTFNINPDLLK